MLIVEWNEVCYPLVSSLDTSWELVGCFSAKSDRIIVLGFYLLLKRSLFLHRHCMLYHIMCPCLNNTWPFPQCKAHVLFFLKKLNKEVIKIQRHTWHPIPIFPTQCFSGGKSLIDKKHWGKPHEGDVSALETLVGNLLVKRQSRAVKAGPFSEGIIFSCSLIHLHSQRALVHKYYWNVWTGRQWD